MEEDVVLAKMVASVLQLAHPEVIAVTAQKSERELHSSLATTSMVLLRSTKVLRKAKLLRNVLIDRCCGELGIIGPAVASLHCAQPSVLELTWRLSPQLSEVAIVC